MLEFDFTNAYAEAVGAENGVAESDIKALSRRISDVKVHVPFLSLPNDTRLQEECLKAADSVRCRFQNLVVLGIGGSALGLRALLNALLPPYFNFLDSKARGGAPRIFVCDNIDPDDFSALLKLLDWRSTCVNIISKSGKTLETAAQFYVIKDLLIKKMGSKRWKEHVIVTTDGVDGPLRTMVTLEHLKSFAIPEKVGGRYSVLSAVGLFPAACVGIDIKELCSGASSAVTQCSGKSIEENSALKNAAFHYILDTVKKKNISVMMPYSSSLSLFADWYLQIWAESLGKDGFGQTPVKALGATDQHSQLQLYMDGPNDKVVTFVQVEKFGSSVSVPGDVEVDFSYLAGKDLGQILRSEAKATAKALVSNKRPSITVTLPEISPCVMGELLMMYQIQTAIAGQLYGIDPFNQPSVELGKKLACEILLNHF